jgi:hypothetical protein
MTQCEGGRWLCQKHSPYTSTGVPKHDEYLKQKGLELFYIMREVLVSVNQLQDAVMDEFECPICHESIFGSENHKVDCPIFHLKMLMKMDTFEFHPYVFFDRIAEHEPYADRQFLQEGRVQNHPSPYLVELMNQYKKIATDAQLLRPKEVPPEPKREPKPKGLVDLTKIVCDAPKGAGSDDWF